MGIAIRCRFLLGTYQARDPFGDSAAAEWPPHPFRLHAALCAAAAEMGGEHPPAAALDALRWLEGLDPPEVNAPAASSRTAQVVAYVPRNPVSAEFGPQRKSLQPGGNSYQNTWWRNGRHYPTSIPHDPVVTYRWTHDSPIPAPIEELVGRVQWLGSSRSPVSCALVEATEEAEPATSLVPDEYGSTVLRVATTGTTDALLGARHEWPTPTAGTVCGYRRSAAASKSGPLTGPFDQLLLRAIVRPLHDVADTPVLTAAVRRAMLSQAGDDAPAALHGHGTPGLRCALLALPDVGHPNASGLVRGVGLALPTGLPPADRAAIIAAFASVDPLHLGDGQRPVRLTDAGETLWALAPERWRGPSRTFATVTPIVLDRHPRRSCPAEEVVRLGATMAGLPDPERVVIERGAPVTGGAHARRLRGPVPGGHQVHATITFAEPIAGPICIGRGRHRGIGLLAPVHEGEHRGAGGHS